MLSPVPGDGALQPVHEASLKCCFLIYHCDYAAPASQATTLCVATHDLCYILLVTPTGPATGIQTLNSLRGSALWCMSKSSSKYTIQTPTGHGLLSWMVLNSDCHIGFGMRRVGQQCALCLCCNLSQDGCCDESLVSGCQWRNIALM